MPMGKAEARPARNQAKGAGQRLPVRAGWRFGDVRAYIKATTDLADIKFAARPMHTPSHGPTLPGSRHAIVSADRLHGWLICPPLTGAPTPVVLGQDVGSPRATRTAR
ncbi:hypothetical protein SAMN06265370_11260 [Puniceibacterium sediminis]|uniref:Uncharacterized protein n=1 Tax=Puniceibacterium sediminis TaxID=1608407 RepID=A0A238XN99_9RHOB|nr:hypothetical protein SAMN06265370_11260 [Puniceibacterium sediminis]